jgi:type II secretory pathway component GspD/PulD (secretin)
VNKWSKSSLAIWLVVMTLFSGVKAAYAQDVTGIDQRNAYDVSGDDTAKGYVARQESLRAFFGGVSSHLGTSIIVSKLAAAKQISGDFNFFAGDIVTKVSRQLGLITYYDGNVIYVYDVSETKNSVIKLKNISSNALTSFLKKSGLADPRYPLRGDGMETFYLSGPPVYVDLVKQAAQFLDTQNIELDSQRVEVIRLSNTFVTDRAYTRRDEDVVIPGIASIVEKLLEGEDVHTVPSVLKSSTASVASPDMLSEPHREPGSITDEPVHLPSAMSRIGKVRIVAYPETNSLLLKGTAEQIRLVRNLVKALDEEKRHVELALWIIDLQKDELDQLGVDWQGSVRIGNQFVAGLNAGRGLNAFSTLEGSQFIASILALASKNKAQIVSRPVLLTQENTPAMFDNNRTFYTPLIAERAVELQNVTYGTLVHVLPRFTAKDEIELSLNIEDGSEVADSHNQSGLPTVGRTRISTVARVPKGKSLLIGGYTRDETTQGLGKIPLLGDIPFVGGIFRYRRSLSKNTVRVFLIQPREIRDGIEVDVGNLQDSVEFEALIRKMDKTREHARAQQEALFNGS